MKRKIKSLITTVIIGGSIMSFGTGALANTDILPPAPNQVYSQSCHGKHHFNEMMTDLVAKKIITQEQATKWVEFRQTKKAERQAEWEKVKNLPKEERSEYWKNHKAKRLDEVVKAGIITPEQANKISELGAKNRNKN